MMNGVYQTQFVCEPVYNLMGRLRAVEVLTKFINESGEILSYTSVQSGMTSDDKWNTFQRQMRCIVLWEEYFLQHQLLVSLNVDAEIVERLIENKACLTLLSAAPFLHLEVSEDFPHSSAGCARSPLHKLLPFTQLWLDDVGSGRQNNFNCLTKGIFKAAKIDKAFFWQHQGHEGIERLGKAIRDLSRYADVVIVEGIERLEHLRLLAPFSHCWLQGFLFKIVEIEHFKTIPLYIDPLGY
ncbi:EAL domain-containing protein [Enterobacter soli]